MDKSPTDNASSDRERFEALFRAHYARVRRYVARRTSGGAVDDVVAETFLTAWRRLDAAPKDDALPWLFGVARRTMATQERSTRRRRALATKIEATESDLHTEQPEPGSELGIAVVQALDRLTANDRQAITLIAWEELTPAQAAIVVGQSRTAFRVRLHRAKRRLVRELECDPRLAGDAGVGPLLRELPEC